MGNRAYVSIRENNKTSTFYLHWNGGPDTLAPVSKALFEILNAETAWDFVRFMSLLDVRVELQKDASMDWTEENGHYLIDLQAKTLSLKLDGETSFRPISDLRGMFQEYVSTKIRAECRDKVQREYWDGIINAAYSMKAFA